MQRRREVRDKRRRNFEVMTVYSIPYNYIISRVKINVNIYYYNVIFILTFINKYDIIKVYRNIHIF